MDFTLLFEPGSGDVIQAVKLGTQDGEVFSLGSIVKIGKELKEKFFKQNKDILIGQYRFMPFSSHLPEFVGASSDGIMSVMQQPANREAIAIGLTEWQLQIRQRELKDKKR